MRFVHISSPSVAHSGASLVGAGATVATPSRTRSHYARSKAMAELLALEADSGSLAVAAIRPHLVWGPGDTQLVGQIVERARSHRIAIVGTGTALIDTTYVDNAAAAVIAAVDRVEEIRGRALVVTNGQPRPVAELIRRIVEAAGLPAPRLRIPAPLAKGMGAIAESAWTRAGRDDAPPMTRFLAEQLSTAHWFDQRQTRAALGWRPSVGLDEGFVRLAAWFDRHGRPDSHGS